MRILKDTIMLASVAIVAFILGMYVADQATQRALDGKVCVDVPQVLYKL